MAQDPRPRPASDVKRLVLCFDGTWNTPEDQTNVSRIYSAIADRHSGCPDQLKFYDAGVGTTMSSRFRGGLLGWGLDENILEGYCWLINEYLGYAGEPQRTEGGESFDAGPDILIFGFSRGAFTARSLAGVINRCGIPRAEHFRNDAKHGGRAWAGADIVKEAWALYRKQYPEGVSARTQAECENFRAKYCWNVKIKFIGVWDTVGALGVPMFSKALFARAKYGFHDPALGAVIEHAYHAVAIDETRKDYKVTLWNSKGDDQKVEQRWFPGAHANIGGGYEDDLLPDPPLRWIAERASDPAVGLEFTDAFRMRLGTGPSCSPALPQDFELRGDEYLSPVRDSYSEFLHGWYRRLRALRFKGPSYRRMLVDGVAETIDPSAHMKWAADPRYRPANLANAGRADFAAPASRTPVEVPAAPASSGNV